MCRQRVLTGLTAREITDQRAKEYEAYALKALETGEDAIARQCAEVVALASRGAYTAEDVLARLRVRMAGELGPPMAA